MANNKYQRENYDRINILAPLNYKAKVKGYAEKSNMSISAYIIKAVEEKIEREESRA
ncbi:MAG: antitoxin [Lachnospiraceae bacterium]|nr:antitoxin [Lachnospiraceae bacterium]